MSVNLGQATGYLDLDTSKFKAGFKSALSDLKVFQDKTATSKDKLAALGSAATSAGKSLTKSLTVPLVGVGVAATAVTAKFDAGMSKVQAISGATGEEMEKLRAKAKEMGAQTKFSATQSAEAFNYMAMAGWKTEDMLNGIEGIMNLAAASGEDLATTSDIVTDALTAFGLSAKDSSHFADALAAASSNANTNVGMMGETFKYVAPVAGALGFSVEDVSTAIGLMANSGIKGSQAGTALRNIFTRMVKPTSASAKVMKQLGVSVTDSSGKMRSFDAIMGDLRKGFSKLSEAEKAQAASALAGQYGMSGLLAIVNSSDKDFNKLQNAINNADGAAQEMADTMMDNLPGSITLAKSALEGLGIRIGEVLTPSLKGVVDKFTAFVAWLTQASDGTVKFAVGLGVVLAAIGPLLMIFGTMANRILSLITLYEKLSKVLAGKTVGSILAAAKAKVVDSVATMQDTLANMRYKLSMSGLGRAVSAATGKVLALAAAHKIAAVAALGVVGAVIGFAVYMAKTGTSISELKDKIATAFKGFVDKLPEIMEAIKTVIGSIIQQLPQIFSKVLSAVSKAMLKGVETLKTLIPEISKWWAKDMPKMIKVGTELIVNLINGFAEALPQMIEAGTEMIVQFINQFFEQAPQLIEAGVQVVLTFLQGVVDAFPALIEGLNVLLNENLGPIVEAIVQAVIVLVQAIVDNAPLIIKAAGKLIVALAWGLIQSIPLLVAGAIQIGFALVKAFLSIVGALIRAGVQILKALWKGISSWAGSLKSKIGSLARQLFQRLVRGIGSLVSSGRAWLAGLWTGMKSKVSSTLSNVLSFAKKLPEKVKSGLGSLVDVGKDFIAGLWNGIKDKFDSTIEKVKGLIDKLPKAVKKVLGIGSPSWIMAEYGRWFIEGLYNGIQGSFGSVMDLAQKQLDELMSVYVPLQEGLLFNGDSTLSVQDPTAAALEKLSAQLGAQSGTDLDSWKSSVVSGVIEAMQNMQVTLDRREMGRFTRKAVTGQV